MALAHSPRIVTNGLILCLDAGNAKSYVGSGVTWTDLTNAGTPMPNTGYFGGGSPGSYSTMDKVTYSSDTTAAVPGANLITARSSLAATGSSTAGYFGGGSPGSYSTMDKVTYSSDTTAAVPGASLSVARQGLSATGNSTAGYFGGGLVNPNAYSTMDKVTYSSDTAAAVPGAFLSAARRNLAATGNSTAGYFGGGTPITSVMNKVTYSTDTTAAVPGASLSVARQGLSATGNSTAGYFGGGTPSPRSTMDKLTYSSDTTAAVPGAALSAARAYLAATGSSTAGYFGGGFPGPVSTMDKVTYSSDTTAAVPGAALSVARQQLAASSARANALPGVDPIKNKLTLINGPTYTSAGGGYLTFNGTDQRATFTIPDLVNYSMSFWVYIISLPASGEEQLFSVHNDYIGISLLYTLNAWKWQSWNANAGPPLYEGSRVGPNVSTGVWYNFVMTRAEQTTKFYINNSLTNTFSNGGDIISGNAYFCSFNTGTDRNLNARLSNVCFYDRELSAAEVSQNFSALRGRYGI